MPDTITQLLQKQICKAFALAFFLFIYLFLNICVLLWIWWFVGHNSSPSRAQGTWWQLQLHVVVSRSSNYEGQFQWVMHRVVCQLTQGSLVPHHRRWIRIMCLSSSLLLACSRAATTEIDQVGNVTKKWWQSTSLQHKLSGTRDDAHFSSPASTSKIIFSGCQICCWMMSFFTDISTCDPEIWVREK